MFSGFYNGYSEAERSRKAPACRSLRLTVVEAGRLACEICGRRRSDIERHSEDYSYPYVPNQHFLCRTCHRDRLHLRFHNPSRWAEFKASILGAPNSRVSPWWIGLSSCPRLRWMFDARPRATSDLLASLGATTKSCNELQMRALSKLASCNDREWTIAELARAIGTEDKPSARIRASRARLSRPGRPGRRRRRYRGEREESHGRTPARPALGRPAPPGLRH